MSLSAPNAGCANSNGFWETDMAALDARAMPTFQYVRIAGGFRRILTTELGQEQLCARCNEPWPMDPEFFNVSGKGVSYECKACVQERKRK